MRDDDWRARGLRGNDTLLYGIILGVLAFWLFAQTTLNIAPAMAADLGIATNVMNIAVSITALFSGIFIVVVGGLADRVGRVKILTWGFVLSIAGSLLVGLAPAGALAVPLLMLGRICQGLSGAFIMPASLALIKTYWADAGRQRAVSLWSMGSWGGSGFAALFGGLMAENVGWRWIFFASAAVAAVGMLMVRGTPESKAAAAQDYRFDTIGVLTFMVTMVALQVLATQGSAIGWTSPITLALGAVAVMVGVMFLRAETTRSQPVRQLRALSQFDLHRRDDLELPLERGRGDAVGVHDAPAAGRRSVRAGSRHAHTRLRDRDCRVHPGRRKAAAEVRPRKPMIWGSLIVGAVDRGADADQPVDRTVHDAGRGGLHTLWRGTGVLRDAVDGCGAFQPAGRSGRIGFRPVQDGLVARRLVRRCHLSRDLHGAERGEGIDALAGGRNHVCRSSGQRRRAPGRADRAGVQPAHGHGGHRVDHAHHPQRP